MPLVEILAVSGAGLDAGAYWEELEALGQRHLSWDTATRTFQASLAGVMRGHMDANTLDGNSLGSRDSRRLLEGLQAELANGGNPLGIPQSDIRMAQNLLTAQVQLQNGLGMPHPDMGMGHHPQQPGLGLDLGNQPGMGLPSGHLLGAQSLGGGSSGTSDVYSGPVRSGTLPADLSELMQSLLLSSNNPGNHGTQQSFQQQVSEGRMNKLSCLNASYQLVSQHSQLQG